MFINQEEEREFKKFIDSCIEERLDQLSDEYSQSAEYLAISAQINAVFNDLKNDLTEAEHHLLLKHEDLYTELLIKYRKYFFMQGIVNAVMLMKFFKP
jgi:hypothetical protein